MKLRALDVSVLRLQPDDVIVAHVPPDAPEEIVEGICEAMTFALERAGKAHPIVVERFGIRFEVARRES